MALAEFRGVIALDGPSGTGKSTVARRLASTMRAAYLDTGAMYRAVTLAVLRQNVDLTDADSVVRTAEQVDLVMGTDPRNPAVTLAGEDVSREIRSAEVTSAVSAVSAIAGVRALLVEQQRKLIAESGTDPGGIVVEGRDIGTVVAAQAGLKVFLTASEQARAQRRTAQDSAAGRDAELAKIQADNQRRDSFDSQRVASPLRKADDAVELDTTDLDVAGVLEQLTKLVQRHGLLVGRERTGL